MQVKLIKNLHCNSGQTPVGVEGADNRHRIRLSDIFLPALCFVWVFLSSAAISFGQSIDFSDGKSLKLASESEFLRVNELIRDQNWSDAARQLSSIVDSSNDELYLLFESNKSKVFATAATRANQVACQWAEQAPEALRAYRDLVDAEARAFLEKASQEDDINYIKLVATKFFASRVGDEATDIWAQYEFENGHFVTAAKLWNSLIPHEGFAGRTHYRYPDSSLDVLQLMTHSIAADLFAKRLDAMERKLSYLENKFPEKSFSFLGKRGLSLNKLKEQIAFEQQAYEKITASRTRELDLAGRAMMTQEVERQSKSSSPFYRQRPTVSEPMDLSISFVPQVVDGNVWWCDMHHVYRWDSKEANRENKPEKIWSTLFPKEATETNRKRVGRTVFDLNVDGRFLFARMGDPRTSYRNDEVSRNRSYLIGLNLEKGGLVMPGFPIENKDPRIEFDATPVENDGRLFVVRRKSFRDNATSQILIQCLGLSSSRRTKQLPVLWESKLVEAESNNRGLWDEVSRTRLVCVENWLVFVGLGFVAVQDQTDGRVVWISDYARDRFVFPGELRSDDSVTGPVVRSQEFVIADQGKLFVAPSDSSRIFCFDMETGSCLWGERFATSSHLLGVSGDFVLAGGNAVNWIRRSTGKLEARFPPASSDNQVGFGIPTGRGIGQGVLDGEWLYWPTLNKIYLLNTKLNRHNAPSLRQVIDLQMRKSTGGNLSVGDGIMLIANENDIKVFGE